MSDLLVTGASGFVGRHLLPRARSAGLRVRVVASDLRDKRAVKEELRSAAPHAAIHLAAPSLEIRRHDPWVALTDELRMVGNLLSALPEGATALLVGSAAQYGMGLDRPLREEDPTDPVTVYGTHKALVERAVLSPALARGVRVVFARAFNHCGPGQRPDAPAAQWAVQLAALRRAGGGVLRTGNLTSLRDFLDVRDVADAYLALALAPEAGGPVNVCSGRAVSLREVLDILVVFAGVEVKVQRDPSLERAIDPPQVVGDPTRLRNLTGWAPRVALSDSLEEQLAEQIRTTEALLA